MFLLSVKGFELLKTPNSKLLFPKLECIKRRDDANFLKSVLPLSHYCMIEAVILIHNF
jgi:hypothetical protein